MNLKINVMKIWRIFVFDKLLKRYVPEPYGSYWYINSQSACMQRDFLNSKYVDESFICVPF